MIFIFYEIEILRVFRPLEVVISKEVLAYRFGISIDGIDTRHLPNFGTLPANHCQSPVCNDGNLLFVGRNKKVLDLATH